MYILILNGSPRKNGTVTSLLKSVVDGISNKHVVEWIDVYDLKIAPCVACMKCRPDKECVLPDDDAHLLGHKIRKADALIVGTPTHWGNMSANLKLLFDRNVPAIMGEKKNGLPCPLHKGKPAIIVTACSTPWPFNYFMGQSSGAIRAVYEVMKLGGFRVLGKIVKADTRTRPVISNRVIKKAKNLGGNLDG